MWTIRYQLFGRLQKNAQTNNNIMPYTFIALDMDSMFRHRKKKKFMTIMYCADPLSTITNLLVINALFHLPTLNAQIIIMVNTAKQLNMIMNAVITNVHRATRPLNIVWQHAQPTIMLITNALSTTNIHNFVDKKENIINILIIISILKIVAHKLSKWCSIAN